MGLFANDNVIDLFFWYVGSVGYTNEQGRSILLNGKEGRGVIYSYGQKWKRKDVFEVKCKCVGVKNFTVCRTKCRTTFQELLSMDMWIYETSKIWSDYISLIWELKSANNISEKLPIFLTLK